MKKLLVFLLLAAATAHGQCALNATVPTNLQVTSVAATTATLTFAGGAAGGAAGKLPHPH